jgi:hypothetical protein
VNFLLLWLANASKGSRVKASVPKNHWKRVRDIVLEVVIAVVLVTGAIIYVASHPRDSVNWDRIALAVNTIVVFGFLISWFRREWKRLLFWTTLVVLLLGHTTLYVLILSRVHEFPLAYYVVLNSMELALFAAILRKLPMSSGSP